MSTYSQKFVQGEIYAIAPLPLQNSNYPHGFKIKLSSEHGATRHMNLSVEQLKQIEKILVDAA